MPSLSPYLIIAAILAFLGAFVAGNLHGHRAERFEWQAATAKLETDAANILATATENNRKKEAADAEAARNVEANYLARIASLEAGRDADRASLSGSVRNITERWKSCTNSITSAINDPSILTGVTTGSLNQLYTEIARDFEQVGNSANKLGEWATACHARLNQVGR